MFYVCAQACRDGLQGWVAASHEWTHVHAVCLLIR